MRVLYVLWAYPARSERFILREIAGLARHGVEVHVAVIGPGPGEVTDEPSPAGRVVRLAEWSGARSFRMACTGVLARPSLVPRLALHFVRTAAREGLGTLARVLGMTLRALRLASILDVRAPDVIHAHFANAPALFARLVATLLEKPWGVSTHAHDLYAERIDLGARLSGAHHVLTCSETALADVRARLPGPFRERALLVYHGVDVDHWRRTEPDPPPRECLVLAAGRFQPKKGFEVLVDACAELQPSGLDFRCELIGDGPLSGALEARIRERSPGGRVALVPWLSQEDLRRRLLEAAVLVVPSVIADDGDRDNIPNVLVEGLLLGIPVVASDLPAIREVLAPDSAGLLVPPGRPAELASAIRSLCEDPALARSLRSNARRAAMARFDLRTTSARMLEVLGAARAGREP